jgi:hypothetical protein
MKNYNQKGLNFRVELSKGGAVIEAPENDDSFVSFTDNLSNNYIPVKFSEPTSDDDGVNKRYLERGESAVMQVRSIFLEAAEFTGLENSFIGKSINGQIPDGSVIERVEVDNAIGFDNVNGIDSFVVDCVDSNPYISSEFNGDINEEGVGPQAGYTLQITNTGPASLGSKGWQLIGDGLKSLNDLISDYNSVNGPDDQLQLNAGDGNIIVENGFVIEQNNDPENYSQIFNDDDISFNQPDLYVREQQFVQPEGSDRSPRAFFFFNGNGVPTTGEIRISVHYRIRNENV